MYDLFSTLGDAFNPATNAAIIAEITAQPEEIKPEPAPAELPLLNRHYQAAYRAFYNLSFSPDKRATSTIKEFSDMLTADLPNVPENYKAKYQSKFEGYFTGWLHSKSRCASSMITGPARFPVARMQKYNQWEDNKYNEFMAWRKRILAALARSERKRTQGSELERATANLNACKKNHEIMKSANAIIRKHKGQDTAIPHLQELGISVSDANLLLHPRETYYGPGYRTFELSNNNANIKRLEQRVKELTAKEAIKQSIEDGSKVIADVVINGAIIRRDFLDDRLKVIFDGKPADNVRKALKDHGFNWSRFLNAWCRKLTTNAYYAAEKILKTELQPIGASTVTVILDK